MKRYIRSNIDYDVTPDLIVDLYTQSNDNDTFFVEAQTQYDTLTIHAINDSRGRYEPTYVLESETEGILSEGTARKVISDFFHLYDVSHDYRRQITSNL